MEPGGLDNAQVKRLAGECGFALAGVARAEPVPEEAASFLEWVERGRAGAMAYLTGRRAALRQDPRHLLGEARSIICVGMLYNTPQPYSTELKEPGRGWISRYAWGQDYHEVLRANLEQLAARLRGLAGELCYRVLVDTAPLLERAYAYHAGLGWIGRNTCLIHEPLGSWFFLGELLTDLDLAPDAPPPDRCGACTRCIDACPTQALVPAAGGVGGDRYELDARRCISYLTIELRGSVPEEHRASLGNHVFGCDICQDVCPWNRRAPVTADPAFAPREAAPPLERLAALSETEFREMFRATPVTRARYRGLLRNVAIAMGNAGHPRFRRSLERLAACGDPLVEEHARWALERIEVT